MVAYFIRWELRDDASPAKGRKKVSHAFFDITVLCNNIKEAITCFEILWHSIYNKEQLYSLVDGDITAKRMKLDSRNFHVQWLFKDNMTQPFYLVDPGRSLLELRKSCY